jgi:hypothetical protein
MYIIQLHPVVHFSWVKGNLSNNIQRDMLPAYSENHLLHKAVYNWAEKFTQGHSKLGHLPGQIQETTQ